MAGARGDRVELLDQRPVALVDDVGGVVACCRRAARPSARRRCAGICRSGGRWRAGSRAGGVMPRSRIAGTRSRSMSRTSRLYSSWQVTKRRDLIARGGVLRGVTVRRRRSSSSRSRAPCPAHQIVERAHGLLDRRLRIGPVHLVEIDPVGAQPLQARLDGPHDIGPRGVARPRAVAHRQPNLVAITMSLRRACRGFRPETPRTCRCRRRRRCRTA